LTAFLSSPGAYHTRDRNPRRQRLRPELTPLILAAVLGAACWIAAAVAVKLQWKRAGMTGPLPSDQLAKLTPWRRSRRERDCERITAQHHQGDQPPNRPLAVGVGSD